MNDEDSAALKKITNKKIMIYEPSINDGTCDQRKSH